MARPRSRLAAARSTRTRAWLSGALLVGALGAPELRAQGASVVIAPLSATPLSAASGGTATIGARAVNGSSDSTVVTPRLTMPAGWTALLGARAFALAPGEADSWMLSLRIPARAAAGRYVVPVDAFVGDTRIFHDSLTIDVAPRRALSVMLVEQPSYAVANSLWRAGFVVRNEGNVSAKLALRATSALSTGVVVETPALTLAANESHTVYVRTTASLADEQSHDDVLELFASDVADSLVSATASARVTIVQRAGRADTRHTVASSLRLRAAQRNTGVSPFELSGGGKLRAGGDEQIDFTLRGSAGPVSPFGDRDQYSVLVRAPSYTLRLGDAIYGSSSLLGNGQMGAGAGVEMTRGTLSFGGFADRARYQFTGADEQAAFVSMRPNDMFGAPQFTLTAINRSGDHLDGRILGGAVTLHPAGSMRVEAELAGSNGPLGTALGRSLHVSGGDRVAYDVSHVAGGDEFASVARGSRHDYGTLSARLTDDLQLSGSASSHESRGLFFLRNAQQELRTSSVELAYRSQLSLRYSTLERRASFLGDASTASQHSIGGRVEQQLGPVQLWASDDIGTTRSDRDGTPHPYRARAYGVTARSGSQTVSFFGDSRDGSAEILGNARFSSLGGDATLHLGRDITLDANGIRTHIPDLPIGEYSQADVRLARLMRNGSSAAIRARFTSGIAAAYYGSRLVFLEYSIPLRLPTDQVLVPGRVRGQVVNETGQGIAGALVRLGPQAAITDDRGRVAFAGVPAGKYHLSLAQQASRLETVFNGDATVQVDSGRRVATPFWIAVVRPGTISGSVRAMRLARTGIGAEPDSLADDGPIAGALVALAGARDTIYRTTNAEGVFDFIDVASGRWTVRVMEATPELERWRPETSELLIEPGKSARVDFLRVPRHREVKILNGDGSADPVEMVPNETRSKQR